MTRSGLTSRKKTVNGQREHLLLAVVGAAYPRTRPPDQYARQLLFVWW